MPKHVEVVELDEEEEEEDDDDDVDLTRAPAARPRASASASSSSSSSSAARAPPPPLPPRLIPWVEKYRPRRVDDVASQQDIILSLRNAVKSGSIPHMLFYGPPGTGKTSTVLAMARDLFGPELFRSRVLELNASDERGIAVVREKVKTFAMGAVGAAAGSAASGGGGGGGGGGGFGSGSYGGGGGGGGASSSSSSSSSSGAVAAAGGGAGAGAASGSGGVPPFKLIILDEADSLTHDAQSALRRTMETHSRVTRFCIICNYVSRIIEPLASRCSKYRFKPLDKASMMARLRHVCDLEAVDAPDATLEAVLKVSGGDLRKAINYLQSASQLCGGAVRPENVVEISGAVPDKDFERLMAACRAEGTFAAVRAAAQGIQAAGYSTLGTLERVSGAVVADAALGNEQKAVVCERVAQAEKKLADGADEELQLLDVCLCLQRAHKKLAVASDKERSAFFSA